MKKLMIAACTVVLAAAVQAATYNWQTSFGAVYDGYDSKAAIGAAWGDATATAGLTWYLVCADTISQGDLLAEFRKGTDISTYKLASGTTTTSGQSTKVPFTADTSLVRADGKMYAYLAVLSDDGKSIFLGANAGQTANTVGGTADIAPTAGLASKKLQDADGKAAYASAGWYTTAAVPEPTSGLLLLLGMAGLALRRRRA